MPCLVKWDPSGINVNINPINVRVRTDTGTNFPDRNPPGFIPPTVIAFSYGKSRSMVAPA